MAVFSLCPHMMVGARGLSGVSWTRALMPFMRMAPNDHFLRPHFQIASHWGLSFNIGILWGDKSILWVALKMGTTDWKISQKFWIPRIKSVKTDPSPGKWTGCTLGLSWWSAPRYLPGPLLTSFKFLLKGSSRKGFSLTTHHSSPPDCSPLPTLFLSTANEVWQWSLTSYVYLLLCWQFISCYQNESLLKVDYFSALITSWSWYQEGVWLSWGLGNYVLNLILPGCWKAGQSLTFYKKQNPFVKSKTQSSLPAACPQPLHVQTRAQGLSSSPLTAHRQELRLQDGESVLNSKQDPIFNILSFFSLHSLLSSKLMWLSIHRMDVHFY